MTTGLIFGFGGGLLGDWVKKIQEWFPIANTGYLADAFGAIRIRGLPAQPGPYADALHAVLVLFGYLIGFVAISMFLPLFDLTSMAGAGPGPGSGGGTP